MTRYLVDVEAQVSILDMPPDGAPVTATGYVIMMVDRATGLISGRYVGEHRNLFEAVSAADDAFMESLSSYVSRGLYDVTKITAVKAPDAPQEP